jgi:hypothetical protein
MKNVAVTVVTTVLLIGYVVGVLIGAQLLVNDPNVGDPFPCEQGQLWDGDACYDRGDHAGHEGI